MSNVVQFPKSRVPVRKLLGNYIADHWHEPVAKEIEEILKPSAAHGSEALALQIVRIMLMTQHFIDISEYTRPLKYGEGWRLNLEQVGARREIWNFTIFFHRNADDKMCYTDIAFRFNLGVLYGTVDLPPEGAYIWPEITGITDGILTLETVQTVLKLYKDEHPKTEYMPFIRPTEATSDELVPISRRAQIGPLYYGTSVCVSQEAYPWIVVME